MHLFKKTVCAIYFIYLGKASALYQGNPAACELPQQGVLIPEEKAVNFKLGYQIEKVFDQAMVLQAPQYNAVGNKISSFFNQGVITLSIIDRLEIFSTFGTMKLLVKQAQFQGLEAEAQSKNSFVWSIGGRAMLLFWENTSLGGEASYLFSHSHLQRLWSNAMKVQAHDEALKYTEWQIQLALSQKVSIVSFYLGGAYCYNRLRIELPWYSVSAEYKNKHKISMVLGSSLSARKGLTFNVEAKFFGETSLGGNVDLRF
jgi:hypothetical protein